MRYFILDAFTTSLFAGNPAAVALVPPGRELADDVRQRLAAELRLSETAFVEVRRTREREGHPDVAEEGTLANDLTRSPPTAGAAACDRDAP